MRFNERQKLFIEEYIKDRNGGAAARRAGYSDNSADQQASRLLRNDKIKKEIDRKLKKKTEDSGVTVEKVVKELAKGGFAELDVADMKFSDKLKCLELLAKYLGMLDGKGKDSSSDNQAAIEATVQAAIERISND